MDPEYAGALTKLDGLPWTSGVISMAWRRPTACQSLDPEYAKAHCYIGKLPETEREDVARSTTRTTLMARRRPRARRRGRPRVRQSIHTPRQAAAARAGYRLRGGDLPRGDRGGPTHRRPCDAGTLANLASLDRQPSVRPAWAARARGGRWRWRGDDLPRGGRLRWVATYGMQPAQ